MSPADLFFLLRRHRLVLLVAVVAGLAAGWITAPGTSDEPRQYEATNTLILTRGGGGVNLDQAALLATTGPVPVEAAEDLGLDVGIVLGTVKATANLTVAALEITGSSESPALAQDAANAVARALVSELSEGITAVYDSQVADLNARITELRAQVAAGPGEGAQAQPEFEAAQSQLSANLQSLGEVTASGPPDPPLRSVEEAEAAPATSKGIQAPESKPARSLLLGGFGLLLGLAAVFALDRLDTRIHTKGGAEAAFGFPVIAEIPPLPPGAHRELLSETHPASQFVEAYRGLRSHVALAGEANGLRPPDLGDGTVILVTSPLAGEGKTTSVAHIAAMLGEVGRSVLVVSGDFRRPRLHELFKRERAPGLAEVLNGGDGAPDVADLDLRTGVQGVQFLTSGAPVSNPAVVVKRTPAMLKAAQDHWEFIIVDSAPLLVANDTAELARAANGVVVLARSGRTTVDAAERTSELLRRIEAPVLGVVLIAANESPTAYRYYRKGYYAENEEPGAGHWWHRHPRAPRSSKASKRKRGRRGKRAAKPDKAPPARASANGDSAWAPADRTAGNVRS